MPANTTNEIGISEAAYHNPCIDQILNRCSRDDKKSTSEEIVPQGRVWWAVLRPEGFSTGFHGSLFVKTSDTKIILVMFARGF